MGTLKQQMFHVSAGRRLKRSAWPDGARVAVALSFDGRQCHIESGCR